MRVPRAWAWLAASWIGFGAPRVVAALTVSPTVVELRAKAGAKARGTFTITNETSEPIAISVEQEPLGAPGYLPRPPAEWLTLSPRSFALKPGEEIDLGYVVKVPKDVPGGELAAEVVLVHEPGGPSGGLQVRYGMALYVSILGTERIDLEVGSLSLHPGDVPIVSIPITNHGNVHCRPEGAVSIARGDGTAVAHGQLTRGMPAPPGELSRFTVGLPGVTLTAGTYRIGAALSCHAVAPLPGRWTVEQVGQLTADDGHWVPLP